jgi:uncharacterized protein (UPF0335 family)
MSDRADINGGDNAHRVAADELRQLIERVERLEDEKAVIGEDIKSVKAEAKACGYDMKAFAEMLKLRKLDKDERDHREALRQTYGEALGVFG